MKLTANLLREENTVFILSIKTKHTKHTEFYKIENRTYNDGDGKVSIIGQCFEDGGESLFHDRWHIDKITKTNIVIWKPFFDETITYKLPIDKLELVSIKPYKEDE